ncbi:MAG TPA: tetratricopeptide repeat protein, partial [Actinomycetes bacterium]|nr:tetratricopeptide repeat protein [Actinomycetes bacterium]
PDGVRPRPDDHAPPGRAGLGKLGPGETRDQARSLMLDVFRLLGDDHPLTAVYRKNLTRALF